MLLPSVLVYAGILLAAAGIAAVVRPIRRLRLPTRRRGAIALTAGVLMAVSGFLWPAGLVRASSDSLLDEALPAYQFSEHHELRVHAAPPRVFEAIRHVTAPEIRFFGLLTWLRAPRMGAARQESLLAAPARKPILEVALSSGFVVVAERPDREIVLGTLLGPPVRVPGTGVEQAFGKFDRPGYAKTAMNFLVVQQPDGWSLVITETRVFATDERARKAFRIYWRLIYPGSALIRREWLRAVKRRAEGGARP